MLSRRVKSAENARAAVRSFGQFLALSMVLGGMNWTLYLAVSKKKATHFGWPPKAFDTIKMGVQTIDLTIATLTLALAIYDSFRKK